LYASPQQMAGADPDPRDDVYALGVIWHQLLTGDLTKGAPTGAAWQRRLSSLGMSPGLLELLTACFEHERADRPANGAALAADLTRLLSAAVPPPPVVKVHDPEPSPPPDDLAATFQRTMQGVAGAQAEARELMRRHDYERAVKVLEAVPEHLHHLRDGALLEEARDKRDRTAELDKTVREKVRTMRPEGLWEDATALLELQPEREDLRRLLATLPKPPEKQIVNSIGMKLTRIPAGTFLMGSPDDEAERQASEGPRHEVAISRAFYLGVYPVLQREYMTVMRRNPSNFGGNPENPVEQVSWEEAMAFCEALSALPKEKAAGRVYRLPTEAEWEYACRAGRTTPFHFGASASSKQANFNGNYPYGGAAAGPYLQKTTKVGSYPANAWGLHDMHGNVWEWCADWYDENYYRNSPKTDPQGPQSGGARVRRGGSWSDDGRNCRAADRSSYAPGYRYSYFGFRVACVLVPTTP
jgi:formylglycine-generating enzyme required for sulfatase activity